MSKTDTGSRLARLLRALSIAVAATVILADSATAQAQAKCAVSSPDQALVMVMVDLQRGADVKTNDMAVLKSFIPILSEGLGELLVRTQFLNIAGGSVSADLACRSLTTRKLFAAYDRIEGKYAAQLSPTSRHFNAATRLDNDFQEMMLSLGAMDVTAKMEKVVIIFGNLDYYIEGTIDGASSRGMYLSDGWLKSPISPFVRNVTKAEDNRFVGAKVIVITDGKDPLSVQRGKENFYATLFNILGGELFYFGPSYTTLGNSSGILERVLTQVVDGSRSPIAARRIGEPQLLQFINRQGSRNVTREDLR